jgi:hypothetical protein
MGRRRRSVRRIFVVGLYTTAAVVLYVLVAPLLPERGTGGAGGADAARAGAIARPQSVPRQVPEWAWTLSAWQSKPGGDRGRRPEAAPSHVPAWYWDWRTWRASTAGSGAS